MTERELRQAVQMLNNSFGPGGERCFHRTWQKIKAAGLLARVRFDDRLQIYVVLAEAPPRNFWLDGILDR